MVNGRGISGIVGESGCKRESHNLRTIGSQDPFHLLKFIF